MSKNSFVVIHFCSGPHISAKSFVIKPLSIVSMQIFSKFSENFNKSELLSMIALCFKALVQAK